MRQWLTQLTLEFKLFKEKVHTRMRDEGLEEGNGISGLQVGLDSKALEMTDVTRGRKMQSQVATSMADRGKE